MIYSKIMHPEDYAEIEEEIEYYKDVQTKLRELVRYQHPARMWEYGTILKILKKTSYKTLIDIGGSGSALSQCFSLRGMDTTIIDFDDESDKINEQNKLLETNTKFIAADFLTVPTKMYDVVISISTIEHVLNDVSFFDKMLDACNKGGLIYLTCDFFTSATHPNEPPTYKQWVNRTYTEDKLKDMVSIASKKGFKLFNNKYDWAWNGPYVYNYNFASLILENNL